MLAPGLAMPHEKAKKKKVNKNSFSFVTLENQWNLGMDKR